MKTKEELLSFAMSRADVDGDLYERDAEIIEYLLNNMPFTIPEGNRFFGSMFCDSMIWVFWKRAE